MNIRDRVKEFRRVPASELRPNPKNPLYGCTSDGVIVRISPGRGAVVGQIKQPTKGPDGYLRVTLSDGNHAKCVTVHKFVAETWIGPTPEGHEIDHKNGDKSDNAVANLEYVTRSENIKRRVAVGCGRGEDNHQSKLTESEVKEILSEHAAGVGYKNLAKKHSVAWETIRDIVKKRIWHHVNS